MDRNTLVGTDFLVMGAAISSLGFLLAQSVPIASFGFALLVIGALLLLVVPEPVPHDAFEALLKDSIRNVEMILEESALKNKAYFIRTADGEVRAFVPVSKGEPFLGASDLKEIEAAPRRLIVDHDGVKGLLLVPPGNEVVRLAGIEAGTALEDALRSVLVDRSDLAGGVLAVEEEGGRLAKVQISRPRLSSGSPYFRDSLGSPVSCVACCVAAAAKGTPVRLVEERFDPAFIRLTLRTLEAS